MRAAFDDLAWDFDLRLAVVVAAILFAAARILRDAARFRRIGFMLGGPPIRGPFPDIADHVVDTVAVRREGHHRRGPIESVLAFIFVREISLPGIGAMLPARSENLAPGELGALQAATRGEFPLRLGRQFFAGPLGISERIGERDVHRRMTIEPTDIALRSVRMAPVGALHEPPPLAPVFQIDRMFWW